MVGFPDGYLSFFKEYATPTTVLLAMNSSSMNNREAVNIIVLWVAPSNKDAEADKALDKPIHGLPRVCWLAQR